MSRTPSVRLLLPILLLASAGLVAGCAHDTFSTREEAQPLTPGQWHRDFLHCAKKECLDWYMVNVDHRVELRVDVYSAAVPGQPDYVLRLEDSNKQQLAKVDPTGQSPREIHMMVDPGLYLLEVEAAGSDGARIEYEILAELRELRPEPPPRVVHRTSRPPPTPAVEPPPPPPRPEPVWVDSEVLEVERDGGEPRFVLIDAGRSAGMRPGLSGRLMQTGEQIGEIEVTEVYDAGSRARIVGPLAAAITVQTKAQIAVPRSER